MNYPLVSIIIPVYQAEGFLRECLESVEMQDYPELEFILVNDGSTDHSCRICEECAAADTRSRVIHQENRGCGAARNAGMKEAKGEYLFFLDADDIICGEHVIRILVEQAEKTKADIVVGNYRRLERDGNCIEKQHHLADENQSSVDFRFKGFVQYGNLSYDWGKLYRRAFLEAYDLTVPEYSYAEDKGHNFRCCACRPKYAFVQQDIVYYRENLHSLTLRPKKHLLRGWIQIASEFEEFLKERGIEEDYGDLVLFHLMLGALFVAKEEMTHKDKKIRTVRKILKRYGADPFVKKRMTMQACFQYVPKITSPLWKLLTFTLVLFFRLHAYYFLSALLVFMSRLGIDSL